MTFKILKGTELFKILTAVQKEMIRCNNEAFALVKELGYKECRGKNMVLAGGLSSIIVPDGKPDGWRNAYDGHNEYFPMKKLKKNKELLARIEALPVVEYDAINKPLKYNWQNHTTRSISFHPGIQWGDKYILVNVPNHTKYKPVPDMVEILESEYRKLSTKK